MKIIDASQLKTNPALPEIPRAVMWYMKHCFETGALRDKIDRNFTTEIGRLLYKFGGRKAKVCFDIEHLNDRDGNTVPGTEPYQMAPAFVEHGTALLTEFISYVREGHAKAAAENGETAKPDFGFYGRTAHPDDYLAWKNLGSPTANWKFEQMLEMEIAKKPLVEVTDREYPSVYGHFEDWYDPDPATQGAKTYSMYGGEWSLDDYRNLQAEVYKQIDANIKCIHGANRKYEWFVTDNKRGAPYPRLNLDWQLTELRKFRKPVNVWSDPVSAAKCHPEGKESFSALTVGIINGHSG